MISALHQDFTHRMLVIPYSIKLFVNVGK